MKSVQMTHPGGPEVVRFAEIPIPEVKPGQLLIEVEFAGLNFTDTLARRGIPGYASGWPFIPGMEVSGRVVKLGPGTTDFRVGDRVVSFTVDGGGLAQFVAADAKLTATIPDALSSDVAATVPLTWAAAIGLVRRSGAGSGDNVLITSAGGGVGHALAALLPRHSVNLIVGGIGSLSKAGSLGAGVVPVERGVDFLPRAQQVVGDNGFDIILESIGGDVLAESVAAIAPGGTVVTYGAAAGHKDSELPSPAELRTGNVAVIGFSIINLSRFRPDSALDLITGVLRLTQNDLLIPSPRHVTWEDAIDAHVEQSEGKAAGKTVIRVK
jgi:NADPH:quinone reductase